MVIFWTEPSKNDLRQILDTCHEGTKNATKRYILGIINSVDLLIENPYLGKLLIKPNIFQMIYKKHRYIYMCVENSIYILAIIHTSKNFDSLNFEIFNII